MPVNEATEEINCEKSQCQEPNELEISKNFILIECESNAIAEEKSDLILPEAEHEHEICIEEELLDESLIETTLTECEYCFDQIESADEHKKQHNDLMPLILTSIEFYRCSRCLIVFPSIDSFSEHFITKEICEIPEELDCLNYQYLDDVDSNDLPIRLYSCCKNPENASYTCEICREEFIELLTFREHFTNSHLENTEQNICSLLVDTPHVCGCCGKIKQNLRSALQHVYFHENEFRCPIDDCNMVYVTLAELHEHVIDNHSLIVSYSCIHCLYLAKDKDDLKMHKQKSCSARNFECNECGKCFLRKNTLSMHLRTHSKERKYACHLCEKTFLQSIDLNNHIRLVNCFKGHWTHKNYQIFIFRVHTKERPYSCHICDKSFKTISQRNDHVDTHNTENKYLVKNILKIIINPLSAFEYSLKKIFFLFLFLISV